MKTFLIFFVTFSIVFFGLFVFVNSAEAFSVQEVATSSLSGVLEVVVDINPVPVGTSYVIPHGHWSFQRPSGHNFGAGTMPSIAELYNEVDGEWTQLRIKRGTDSGTADMNYRVSVVTSDFVSVQQNTVSGTTGVCGWDNDVDVSRSFGILQWTTEVTNNWTAVMSKTFELNPGSMSIMQALPHSSEEKHCQVIEFQEIEQGVSFDETIQENATEVCETTFFYEEGEITSEEKKCYRPLDVFGSLFLEAGVFVIFLLLMFGGFLYFKK